MSKKKNSNSLFDLIEKEAKKQLLELITDFEIKTDTKLYSLDYIIKKKEIIDTVTAITISTFAIIEKQKDFDNYKDINPSDLKTAIKETVEFFLTIPNRMVTVLPNYYSSSYKPKRANDNRLKYDNHVIDSYFYLCDIIGDKQETAAEKVLNKFYSDEFNSSKRQEDLISNFIRQANKRKKNNCKK